MKLRLIKKSLGFIAVAGMALVLTTGCNQATDDTPVATQPPTPAATQAPGGTQTDPPAAVDTGPEHSYLRVMVWDRGHINMLDNPYVRWIAQEVYRELNMTVEFVPVPRWSEDEATTNLLAAREAPDIAFTFSGGMVSLFGSQGGITNLAPYLENAATLYPNLYAFTGELLFRNADPVSGEIFSIMQRRIHTPRVGTFIRQDWLDILGLPVPRTLQEFEDALIAFRDYDPGNMGTVIPLAMTGDMRWRASTLLESFIDPNLSRREMFVYNYGGRPFLFPGVKEGARVLNRWYNEGLIDRDFVLYADDEASDNLTMSGFVGAYIHNWDNLWRAAPGIQATLSELVDGGQFVPIDPFVNPVSGVTQKFAYDPAGFHVFIPATSNNVEGALRYLDWLAILENRMFLQIGPEGYTHELVDGVPAIIAHEGYWQFSSPNNIDMTPLINGVDLGSVERNAAFIGLQFPGIDPALVAQSYEIALTNSSVMPFLAIPGGTPIGNAFEEMFFSMGSELLSVSTTAPIDQFDETWDRLFAGILAAGAQAALDERNAGFWGPEN
jgi:putative aldouronate transport system substrate-binding protein